MATYYVSIGNSDDKLTQREWSQFYERVDSLLSMATLHGRWASFTDAPYQNACWCIEINESQLKSLKFSLASVAYLFRQDSIALATATTEFIQPEQGI